MQRREQAQRRFKLSMTNILQAAKPLQAFLVRCAYGSWLLTAFDSWLRRKCITSEVYNVILAAKGSKHLLRASPCMLLNN